MPHASPNWSRRELAFGAALCAALATLAVLQYRWIGQVGEAERIRLDRDLRTSVNRFVDDFDGELQRLAGALIGSAVLGADPDQRVALWRATTRYPDIVERVREVPAAALPPSLLDQARRIPGAAGRGGPGGGPPLAVDPNLPAIAIPMGGPRAGTGAEWLLIEFNLDYMRGTWLPELVARHFGAEFHVEVDGPNGPLYRSDNEPAAGAEEAGIGGLFGFRNAALGRGRGRGFKGAPPLNPPPGPPPEPQPEDGAAPSRENGRGFPGAPAFLKQANGAGPGGPRWRVLASYKGGTLDQRVTALRTRNLAVSFGMLLLMGVSVAMLLLSSRRARLLARQQMEFVAGVTHELRTPLAVITSASQNLADGVTSGAEQTRRYGAVISHQGKRLSEMVEQILRFAGLASERAEMRRQPVNVADVIEQAVADCQPDLAASGSELTRAVAPGLPEISGDPASLVHCLRNLLGNAVKHGQGAPVRLEACAAGAGVEIRVRDEGPGIDAADLAHIFEPFYRGRRATSEQIQGAGLGLSLVKKIAEAHGGSVEVASRAGQGTSFVLRLPAAAEE